MASLLPRIPRVLAHGAVLTTQTTLAGGVFSLAFFSTLMAGSGHTVSQMPHMIQPSSRILTEGVPINPNTSDQYITLTGHFSMQSPQPLQSPGKIDQYPRLFSWVCTNQSFFTPIAPCQKNWAFLHMIAYMSHAYERLWPSWIKKCLPGACSYSKRPFCFIYN